MRTFLLLLALVACDDKQTKRETPPVPAPEPAPEPTVPTPTTPDLTTLAKNNNNFAIDLWSRLPPGNLAMSPTSVSIALAMTWGGAKGTTADEMREVLHFEGAPDAVMSQWGQVAESLQDPKRNLTMKIANRLYGEKTFEWDTIYFRIVNEAFKARIEVADFKGDPEGERTKINTWVEKATETRIKNLLPPRSVGPDTRLILVNAIYFLADWENAFDPKRTGPRDFHTSASQKKLVPTMHRSGEYRYASGDGAALLELPYKGGSAAMYVMLPDKIDGLAALEANLAPTLKSLQPKLADARVDLALPSFTIDPATTIDLAKTLQAMGMPTAFIQGKADFTGIAKPVNKADELFISAVFHKAFVKVDEKGTEAAAATAVAMPRGGPPPSATKFTADHPFVFLIVDRQSGLILFIGRVVDPA